MKLFAYSLREYDELPFLQKQAAEKGFDFGWTPEYPSLDNLELARGYDALTIITNPMTPEFLSAAAELGIKSIATRSIGYEHIDLAAARDLGIRVAHAAYPPCGVADYTVMLILMALRKVKFVMGGAAYQDFDLKGKIGKSLSACTVGVVGTGAIGEAVCRRLAGFGCKILASDPFEKESLKDLVTYVELDKLLAAADVVTLHAPGLPQNTHMIGKAQFALMKPGVAVVNAARGALIDTAALMEAVESGKVGAAALDTIEHEAGLYYLDRSRDVLPNHDRAILMGYPNVIVSPHMAFYTEEYVENVVATNVDALLAFDAGQDSPLEVR